MFRTHVLALGFLAVALMVAGCTRPASPSKEGKKDAAKKDDHAHGKGPNGGVVFDLGKHHAEFTVNHGTKECTILMLGGDEISVEPVAAKEFTLTTKETKTKEGKVVAPMAIKMLAKDEKDGKASRFVGTDPGLGNVADFEGTVIGQIDGRPSQGTFKE